jgi:hypothetical protein
VAYDTAMQAILRRDKYGEVKFTNRSKRRAMSRRQNNTCVLADIPKNKME